jgi:selenocysteine-specific elongation factor
MRVIATAGHVDHGKSSLVLALTGTDPDRFPEEKARGLTIDLGFAFTTLGGSDGGEGEVVGFVDVPGHIRFIKNMLAGVGAVEVALLVVAANEGWMPQTDEHARILELLGVEHGLVVLSKADLVDEDTLELAQLELADGLADRPLGRWPVVVADALSGRGIESVRETLAQVLAAAPLAADRGRPRLWVDRSFAARGAGTVVTGTLGGGALTVDTDVIVEPGGHHARVRGIESHHEQLERVAPGARVAVNLAGIEHSSVKRGDAIVLEGQWAAVAVFDAALTMVPGEAPLRRGVLQCHVGSGVHPVRVRPLDDPRYVRLRFVDTRLPLAPGDRLVLRSSARRTTVAGATVLDVEPTRRAADAPHRLSLSLGARVLAARPWTRADDIVATSGTDRAGAAALLDELVVQGAAQTVGGWTVASETIAALRGQAVTITTAHHASHPIEHGIDLALLAGRLGIDAARLRAALADDATLVVERDTVRLRTHGSGVADDPAARRFLDALEASPFSPPSPAELDVAPEVVRALLRDGVIVSLDGFYFSASALDEARARVSRAVLERGALKLSDVRDLLGSTRKYVVPIASRLDADGVTRRRGDDRIAGPKASDYASGG